MRKFIEASGKNEDEALTAALEELGLDRDDVSIELIERAKSGFLGIGSSPAKIRVYYEAEESAVKKIETFLKGLFERMGANVESEITEDEDGNLKVLLTGQNLGVLIGRRGETLDAIQGVANRVANRGSEKRIRVTVDAENYRSKREESLRRLAQKVAAKVVKYRKNVTLEPMNAYERHIIHEALQDFDGVCTRSAGTEPNRRVIVVYEGQNR